MKSKLVWILCLIVLVQSVAILSLVIQRQKSSPSKQPRTIGSTQKKVSHEGEPLRKSLPTSNSMETEIAERTRSVSFSYGSPKEAGRYVGQTFNSLFEAANSGELEEVNRIMKSTELDLLSMGPFIRDAELIEKNPSEFAEFQSSLLSEIFGLDIGRQNQLQMDLESQMMKASNYVEGSEEWLEANQEATDRIVMMLSPEEKELMKEQIEFISAYGVLVTPTYSLIVD